MSEDQRKFSLDAMLKLGSVTITVNAIPPTTMSGEASLF